MSMLNSGNAALLNLVVGINAAPAWALHGLSDLSIPIHMIYAYTLVDLYIARKVLREIINPSNSYQFHQIMKPARNYYLYIIVIISFFI